MAKAASGLEQHVSLVGEMQAASEGIVLRTEVDNLVGEMVDIDGDIGDAGGTQLVYLPFEQGLAPNRQKGFGNTVGDGFEASAESGSEYHGFHRKMAVNVYYCYQKTYFYCLLVDFLCIKFACVIKKAYLCSVKSI